MEIAILIIVTILGGLFLLNLTKEGCAGFFVTIFAIVTIFAGMVFLATFVGF